MNQSIKRVTKTLFPIVLLLILTCFPVPSQAEETSINIICTNSLLADFTSNLLTENVSIDYIMPSGVCPAQYDTTPSDIDKIVTADIIISIGSPKMDGWLEALLAYNPDADLIESTYMGEWNIPSGAKKYVEKIRDELALLLPDHNETIQTNAEEYIIRIDETAEQLLEMVQNNRSQDKKIICIQWYKDFLEWLGLNVTYYYGSPEFLSLQDEIDIMNAASDKDVCAVIDNLQSGTEFGAHVASQSGVSHIIFTNFPEALPGTDTYLEVITYNTRQLINGISTYEYKQGRIKELESTLSGMELQRNASLILVFILGLLVVILFLLYKKK